MSLLSARDLRLRLKRAGAQEDAVAAAIERLEELGLLDDRDYARNLARSRVVGGGVSKRKIGEELQRRGVSRRVADEAIAEMQQRNQTFKVELLGLLKERGSTAVAVSDGTVQVDPGDAVVCTFTNTRSTGGLTLRKVVVDPVGSNHTFDLLAGADVVVDEAVDGSTGTTTVNSGPVTVSETSGALGRYTTAIACTSGGQPLASGGGTSLTVEVSAGSNVVCTFTNTRRTGTLEVRKQLVPTNDPGTFDLSIDGTVRTAGAGHNGTTGPVVVAAGTHSVAAVSAMASAPRVARNCTEVSDQLVTVCASPPTSRVLEPCVAPNPLPVTVTVSPGLKVLGVTLVIEGPPPPPVAPLIESAPITHCQFETVPAALTPQPVVTVAAPASHDDPT